MRNDGAGAVVVGALVPEAGQARSRGGTGVRLQGAEANPLLLAANRASVLPAAVFRPPADSTRARVAVRPMAVRHPAAALNPPANPEPRPPIARAIDRLEAAIGKRTPGHARAIGQTPATTGRRIVVIIAAIARKRAQTARRTARTAVLTVPIRARMATVTGLRTGRIFTTTIGAATTTGITTTTTGMTMMRGGPWQPGW
jgi:hypothetical protein